MTAQISDSLAMRWKSAMQRSLSNNYLHLWLMALFAVVSMPCLAQPKFVYRVDTRPPEEIFTSGFTTRGTNLDLRRYMSNSIFVRSRGPANNPGFIATTEYRAAALRISESTMFQRALERVYIYRIRANNDFYDLNLSVRHLREVSHAAGCAEDANVCTDWLQEVSRGIAFMSESALQSTFVSDRSIPANMIASVDVLEATGVVRIVDHAMQQRRLNLALIETIDNHHYIDADTRANPNPYTAPEPVTSASSSACRPPMPPTGDDESGSGPAGPSCEGDLVAVAGPSGYMHPGLFPNCPSSSHKRSLQAPDCTPPPTINLSKLRRAMRVLIATDDLQSASGGQGHGEL